MAQAYNAKARAVAAHYQSLNYANFTVVSQPFGRNTAATDLPDDFLSNLDCFHPSLVAHEAMAIALWYLILRVCLSYTNLYIIRNNMLTPMAQKKTYLDPTDIPLCPTADTLLYTK